MIERIKLWFKSLLLFFKGPKFQFGQVVRYANVMRRISHVGWDKKNSVWRYRLQGETKVDYSEAEIGEMVADLERFLAKKIL